MTQLGLTHRFSPALLEAAKFERDQRQASYPPRVAAGQLDEDAATIDWQCWVAIVEWAETGMTALLNRDAGIMDPPTALLGWATLEAAAERALATIQAKVDRGATPAICDRRDDLWAIHHRLKGERELAERTAAAISQRFGQPRRIAA